MLQTTRDRLIVVGNGMVGHSFCRSLTDSEAHKYSIIVFGEEPRPAYDRVGLTSYFGGASPEQLELSSREWYAQRGIDLRLAESVVQIDRENRCVLTDQGETYTYDKLVMATGSLPFVPSIPGVDLKGVFTYRRIEDLQAIASRGSVSKTAAVLGGGLLGLEAAKALRDMHLIPHVVEMGPVLMPKQLDRDSAEYLRAKVERLGVQVHLTKRTQSIEAHGDFLLVKFDTGDSLAVDMVVISAGIRARDELARDAGLAIGERGGIVVDDRLCSSDSSIFAIGECANHRGIIYGLVGPGYQMAEVLADHLRGGHSLFKGSDQSAKLKLLGVDVSVFGEPIGQAVDSVLVSAKLGQGSRKLILRDKRIVGAIGVGPWPESDRVRAAVAEARRPWAWQLRRFERTGNLWSDERTSDVSRWPPATTVCSCLQVKRSELTTACQQGCNTVAMLSEKTGAGTVCGSCRPLLASMVGKAEEMVAAVAGWRGLLVASVAALAFVLVMALSGPIEYADSVRIPRRQIDFFWRDGFSKKVTGYLLLAITVASLILSLRKRWKKFSLGPFGNWRMAHGMLGVVTLLGVVAHTGFHMGSNLNFWLMSCFVGINVAGALTGVMTSCEARCTGAAALRIRQWRPRLTMLHILFFWPLPILITAHVFCVYYY